MKRREFITLLGGATLAWPLAARAQQGERVRRIGVIMGLRARDAEALLRVRAFESSWRKLGWVEGRNIRVDYRWAPGDAAVFRAHATAFVEDVAHRYHRRKWATINSEPSMACSWSRL